MSTIQKIEIWTVRSILIINNSTKNDEYKLSL